MLANSVLDRRNPNGSLFTIGLWDVHAAHRLRPMRTCLAKIGEQPPALLGSGGHSPIYARRGPPVIDLRHLTDGEDQVGITPQEQLLQATHLPPVPLLRRAKRSAVGAVAPPGWRSPSRCWATHRPRGSGPWSRSL